MSIKVLFEDNHVIAVVKPPGVLSQEDDTGDADMLTLLKQDIKERYNKPGNVFLGLVHRLDRMVGGVMILPKPQKLRPDYPNRFAVDILAKLMFVLYKVRQNNLKRV